MKRFINKWVFGLLINSKKSSIAILLSIAIVINMTPQNALATIGSSNAIITSSQAVDVIINADRSYTGSLSEFANSLNTNLLAKGVNARIVTVNNDIGMDNFDDWYVYDHYYSPAYATDGSAPSDWDSHSGRHPYYYYKEESINTDDVTTDDFNAAEVALHDELYAEYSIYVYACVYNKDELVYYIKNNIPYISLSDEEKAALAPVIRDLLNDELGTRGTSLEQTIEEMKDLLAFWYCGEDDYDNLGTLWKAIVDSEGERYFNSMYVVAAYSLLDDSGKRALADAYIASHIDGYADMTDEGKASAMVNYRNEFYDMMFGGYLQPGESFSNLDETQKESIFNEYYYNEYIYGYEAYDRIIEYATSIYHYYTDLTGTDYIHYRDKHIYTSVNGSSINMTFLGYSAPDYKDFKLYPTSQEVQKTVEFDIDASLVSTHTLEGAGFLVNSGIDTLGYIHGYILFYQLDEYDFGTVYLLKINDNVTADQLHQGALGAYIQDYSTEIASVPFSFNSTSMKKHVSINILPNSVSCTDVDYTDAGGTTLSDSVNTLFDAASLVPTEFNGFGPIVSYYDHACEEISIFTFSDLQMKFMSMPIDSLRNATYRSDSNVPKVFINLTDETEKALTELTAGERATYNEMQTRLAQDHIFYISTGGDTIINSINGNGQNLLSSTDKVTDASNYIKSIVTGSTIWSNVSLSTLDASTLTAGELLPTAIFDVLENNTGNTVLRVNRNYVGDGLALTFGNRDKSISRATDANGDSLTYTYNVYDPLGRALPLSGSNELIINTSSLLGDYTFALTVTDRNGRVSKTATRTVRLLETDTVPDAPVITVDDNNNILLGADATMEYSTDAGMIWRPYNPNNSPTFSGNVTVMIRVAADGINPAGAITTVGFTANPSTPTIPTTVTENIKVDVKEGATDTTAVQIPVERTTNADGSKSDNVVYDIDKANETINQFQQSGASVARIHIPDENSEVDNTKITIPTASMDVLANGEVGLQIDTEEAKIMLPASSVQDANDQISEDLYFKLIPVKDQEDRESISNRAIFEASIWAGDSNHSIQLVGVPVAIETNLPPSEVDIVLPLTGVTLPSDSTERDEFLKQLAVYIEHSDGTKEIVQGEIVEYAPGVLGIKFHINKFSIFTIVKTDLFQKATEKDVLKVIVPKATTIKGDIITATVDNSIDKVTVKLKVSDKATWKLYLDKSCTKEVENSQLTLAVGKNTIYVKVTAEDGSYKTYKMTITRAKTVESAFSPLLLVAKAGETTQTLSYQKVSGADGYILYGAPCGVDNHMEKIADLSADVTSYKVTGLAKNTHYKYMVKAYKITDGKKTIIAVSKMVHSTTNSSKYTNPTKVTSNVSAVSLKVGKSQKLICSVVSPQGKTVNKHVDTIRYESTNTAIAQVDSCGKITAKGKGTCYIYAYAQNGVYKKIKVTVK